jgi:glutamine amidotransferase
MFMHNGFIGSWNRLRRQVERMIPDQLYPSRVGTTDSEAVFLAMLGNDLDRDPVNATRQVLRKLCQFLNEDGHRERMRFTAALANGHDLFAFRFAANDSANTLYFRESGERLIVVSEPFDKEQDWTEVPINHVLIARESKPIEIVPFLPFAGDAEQEPFQLKRVIAAPNEVAVGSLKKRHVWNMR